MTEEDFFNSHQILYRGNSDGYHFIVVNIQSGSTRRYNFDKSNIDEVFFDFYTGKSLDDEIIETLANEIRHDYNIESNGN